jgi:hypothetical protein
MCQNFAEMFDSVLAKNKELLKSEMSETSNFYNFLFFYENIYFLLSKASLINNLFVEIESKDKVLSEKEKIELLLSKNALLKK